MYPVTVLQVRNVTRVSLGYSEDVSRAGFLSGGSQGRSVSISFSGF